MSVILTTAGENLILKALAQGTTVKLDSYLVADSAGFDPSPDDVTVRGNVVFGSSYPNALPLRFNIINQNQLNIFTEFLPNVGPFQIGNIGFFSGGVMVAQQVLSQPYLKEYQPSTQESNIIQIQSIIIASSISLVLEGLNLSMNNYYSAEVYDSINDLPDFNSPSNNFAIVKNYESPNGEISSRLMFKSQELLKWVVLGADEYKLKNINMSIR